MITISREKLLAIARISYVRIDEEEIPGLLQQLHEVLTYAARVKEIAQINITDETQQKNSNVFRDDLIYRTEVQPIIEQAPHHERNYFIVPAILEN